MKSENEQTLTEFERAVLDKLLAGNHPVLAALRGQLASCRVSSRKFTGHGFFAKLDVDRESNAAVPVQRAKIRDVGAEIPELKYGAGFVLFVADGYLDVLEGFTYDEHWPRLVRDFTLMYARDRIENPGAIELS